MDKFEIDKIIGSSAITVAEAMRMIDANARGILFIVDENQMLSGCVTDGDIRRFLLDGGRLEDNVLKAANRNPRTASDLADARIKFHARYLSVLPIVNEGRIVDIFAGDIPVEKHRSSLNIPVVINAGGKGTRLEPFTKVLPKPLIPVGDLPIVELIMKEFMSYNCDDFHIIVNYKRELMKAYFADNENRYNIKWYDEKMPLGTGGGLGFLKGKLSSTFFFTNCDALLTANYERILQFHRDNRNVITMVCAYKNLRIPYGVVEMGKNGRIEGMKEKPMVSFLTNTGIYIVEPEVVEDIEEGVPIGFPDIVEKERQMGKRVAVFPVSENDWMDMGQLSELEKMRTRLYGE